MSKRLDVGTNYANVLLSLTVEEREELAKRMAAQAVVSMFERARPYLNMAEKVEKAK